MTCDVRTAIRWLAERDYVAVLLDHDLAEEHYFSDAPDDERTGYAVARWLADHPTSQRDALILIQERGTVTGHTTHETAAALVDWSIRFDV